MREYRIDEIADATGISVRTLRYYQHLRLIPPPRRDGRIGWYSEAHKERLAVIAQLVDQGHALAGIRALLSAWDNGRDVAELLGFARAVTGGWTDEELVRVSFDELNEQFLGQVTEQLIDEAVDLGFLTRNQDGTFTHVSQRHLEATTTLVRSGMPLREVLAAGRVMRDAIGTVANLFVELFRDHVLGGGLDQTLPPSELQRVVEFVDRLRPVSRTVVDVYFDMAMDKRVTEEFGALLGGTDDGDGPSDDARVD